MSDQITTNPNDSGLRNQQKASSPDIFLWLTGAGLLVLGLLTWYLSVALTTNTADLKTVLRSLVSFKPMAGVGATGVTVVVWIVFLLAFGVIAVVGWIAWGRRAKARKGLGLGLASSRYVAEQAGAQAVLDRSAHRAGGLAAATGQQTAASAAESVGGFSLGREKAGGHQVFVPVEDHVLIEGITGSGKSSGPLFEAAATAPGPLVVTMTRPDLLDKLADTWAEKGKIWVFDPLNRAQWPKKMVWSPVAGCHQTTLASARAVAFTAGQRSDQGTKNSGFFAATSEGVFQALLAAAAVKNATMLQVVQWAVEIDTSFETVAQTIINGGGNEMFANQLRALCTGAPETVANTRMSVQNSLRPLFDPAVLAWLTPTEGVEEFDPFAFVTSTDTLVLISDSNSSTNVSPLTTMLFNEVIDAAKMVSSTQEGSMLPRVLRVVGDEIANVAPIPGLPAFSTDARGFGIQLVLAIQAASQVKERWGAEGASLLLSNMAWEVILPGVKNHARLEELSKLVGTAQVQTVTSSTAPGGGITESASMRWERVLRPEQVRQLATGCALVIARNLMPMIIDLQPWFRTARADQIKASAAQREQARIAAAKTKEGAYLR